MSRLLVPPKILFICILLDASLSHESHVIRMSLYRHKRAPFWRRNAHSPPLSLSTLQALSTIRSVTMSFLFGRRKTPEEMLRQNQRALQKVRLLRVYYGIVHLAKAFLSLKYLDFLSSFFCNFSGNKGIREGEDVPREAREETHHRHQEDGKERANGRREDHGEGPGQD